jgi:hypothetical protein
LIRSQNMGAIFHLCRNVSCLAQTRQPLAVILILVLNVQIELRTLIRSFGTQFAAGGVPL